MITGVIYCPECGRCYHSASLSMRLGCGHRVDLSDRGRICTQEINGYEWVKLQRKGNIWNSFLVRPDGSVQWCRSIYSAREWEERLARRHPLYPAAFRARRDIDIFRRIPEDLT